MTPRALLSDLLATAPAAAASAMERASDAYDAGDMDTVAITLFAVSRSGLTTWHSRAAELADQIDVADAQHRLEDSLTQATGDDWQGVLA